MSAAFRQPVFKKSHERRNTMNAQNEVNAIDEDAPLDPATEKVRKKMVRLLATSIGIMMIGLMAVLGAIVYKVTSDEDEVAADSGVVVSGQSTMSVPAGISYEGKIELPPGAVITGSSLSGGQLMLQVRLPDETAELWLYDLETARVFGRITLQ